jgi:hypothetical protein
MLSEKSQNTVSRTTGEAAGEGAMVQKCFALAKLAILTKIN